MYIGRQTWYASVDRAVDRHAGGRSTDVGFDVGLFCAPTSVDGPGLRRSTEQSTDESAVGRPMLTLADFFICRFVLLFDLGSGFPRLLGLF